MMVLGTTTQPLLALETLVPVNKQPHLLTCKVYKPRAAVSRITGIPFSFLGPVFPTCQPQADCTCKGTEAASQKVTERKSVAGVCCKNTFREGEILVLENG